MVRAQSPACIYGESNMARRSGYQSYAVDSSQINTLGVEVDALAFFKDNEYDGDVQHGYSLPGVRIQPRLTYTPIKEVKLELGLHGIIYAGANKYPCYVFHDIATWKGDQYQSGAHMLPFFRVTGRFKNLTLALGDIYGGATHGLVEPLYNPELNLTDDPEMGCQLIMDTRRWHSDLWMNWQSYIFKESTHQEAFTLGWTQTVNLLDRKSSETSVRHSLHLPIQVILQHRGGEQDSSYMGVQTVANAALGLAYEYHAPQNRVFNAFTAEAMAMFCLQQSGKLLPFDNGNAIWASVSATFIRNLRLTLGFFSGKDFCSLYGNPFFGTLSTKYPGAQFDGVTTGMLSIEYSKTFAGRYTVGANAKAFLASTGTLTRPADAQHPQPYTSDGTFTTPFSFGVYFRCSPSFVIKRFTKS